MTNLNFSKILVFVNKNFLKKLSHFYELNFEIIYTVYVLYFSPTFYDKAKLIENYSFRFSINVLKIPLI